ncbi:hypothetical protein K7X08_029736 [Anisodus acutangulus]|uniref:RING-type E3 ubiquitin transferase n=1 Tax=Anisodus acutangulus TaxID=402998 RepID=A0A9Q1L384_9SOLA|nr:hypothetical protein K7X08_029736 [Anisodus acutangulus]
MAPWGGLSCCLSAAALYLLGRSSGRDAEVLKSVTRVNQLKDLAQLLDTASKVLPLVVTISGRVGSDTPINCEYSGLRGVIVEETAEQHFLKHNDAGSWIQDSALMLSMCKEVPWYLDDGTGRTFVVGGRGATGLEAGRSFVRGTLDYLQGLKMLGVKRIERVLPVGTPLTVVGEAVKDDIGTVRIQRPHKGPFYISHKTIDQLIANLGRWARWYKYASMGFTAVGVYLLVKHTFHYVMERKRHLELRRRVLAAAAKRAGHEDEGSNATAENGVDNKKDHLMPDLCVICLEQEYNSVFVPCGHMCCCMTCSSHLTNCPLCRRLIEQSTSQMAKNQTTTKSETQSKGTYRNIFTAFRRRVSTARPLETNRANVKPSTAMAASNKVLIEYNHSSNAKRLEPMKPGPVNIHQPGPKAVKFQGGYSTNNRTSGASNEKFTDFIDHVKNKIKANSSFVADENVASTAKRVTTRRDSFNDRVSHFINRGQAQNENYYYCCW